MEAIVFVLVLAAFVVAASRWGVDSRPPPEDHDRWWPGIR
jgi:hypothetical protein